MSIGLCRDRPQANAEITGDDVTASAGLVMN
jgi:hypothetical protein